MSANEEQQHVAQKQTESTTDHTSSQTIVDQEPENGTKKNVQPNTRDPPTNQEKDFVDVVNHSKVIHHTIDNLAHFLGNGLTEKTAACSECPQEMEVFSSSLAENGSQHGRSSVAQIERSTLIAHSPALPLAHTKTQVSACSVRGGVGKKLAEILRKGTPQILNRSKQLPGHALSNRNTRLEVQHTKTQSTHPQLATGSLDPAHSKQLVSLPISRPPSLTNTSQHAASLPFQQGPFTQFGMNLWQTIPSIFYRYTLPPFSALMGNPPKTEYGRKAADNPPSKNASGDSSGLGQGEQSSSQGGQEGGVQEGGGQGGGGQEGGGQGGGGQEGGRQEGGGQGGGVQEGGGQEGGGQGGGQGGGAGASGGSGGGSGASGSGDGGDGRDNNDRRDRRKENTSEGDSQEGDSIESKSESKGKASNNEENEKIDSGLGMEQHEDAEAAFVKAKEATDGNTQPSSNQWCFSEIHVPSTAVNTVAGKNPENFTSVHYSCDSGLLPQLLLSFVGNTSTSISQHTPDTPPHSPPVSSTPPSPVHSSDSAIDMCGVFQELVVGVDPPPLNLQQNVPEADGEGSSEEDPHYTLAGSAHQQLQEMLAPFPSLASDSNGTTAPHNSDTPNEFSQRELDPPNDHDDLAPHDSDTLDNYDDLHADLC